MSYLTRILRHYGFDSIDQQEAILQLLTLAKVFEKKVLRDDLSWVGFETSDIEAVLGVIENAGSRFTSHKMEVLNQAFSDVMISSIWPQQVHDWLIRVTQREFFARPQGKERWEMETGAWIAKNTADINGIIKTLQLTQEKHPKLNAYDAMIIMGGTALRMENRLKYAKKLIDEAQIKIGEEGLVLLCGERRADPNAKADGKEYMEAVSLRTHIPSNRLLESHLMEDKYQAIKGQGIFGCLYKRLIDTPKEDRPRATTTETTAELARWLPSSVKNLLFISNVPEAQGQAENIHWVLTQRLPQVVCETVGDNAGCDIQERERILSGLATRFFWGYPRVAKEMGSRLHNAKLTELREFLKYDAAFLAPKTWKQYLVPALSCAIGVFFLYKRIRSDAPGAQAENSVQHLKIS